MVELKGEKKKRTEDARKVEEERKKFEDSHATLREKLEVKNHRNHKLSKEIKWFRAEVIQEKRTKDEALM